MEDANGFAVDITDFTTTTPPDRTQVEDVQLVADDALDGSAADDNQTARASAPVDGDALLMVEDRLTMARRQRDEGQPSGGDAGRASLRQSLADYASPDVWKGMAYVASYLARAQAGAVRRRLGGVYEVDDYGLDREFLDAVLPVVQFLYQHYWRVDVSGIDNLPAEGPALLVSNHSGVLPFDGAMISTAILNEMHPPRLARALVADWFPTLPLVSILLQKTGQVQANPHNALRLLQQGELVAVFPEGYKGVGKLYRDRYQLARFGRGGFIRIAVTAGVPIIPVAVVGAEETYPMIARSQLLARLLGFPFFPITPTFPLTGLLGFVPVPSKWSIDFGRPIIIDHPGARSAANPVLVSELTEQVRGVIQSMLLERLAKRRSIVFG
jgi:1-acyl-sn-glycerol-3-phosphate acyltransferase